MLGYESPDELITSFADLDRQFYVKPGRRQEFIGLMEKHKHITDFEFEVYRKDGNKMWISENSYAVRDENGTLLYYEGTAVDITERRRAEASLMAAKEKYQSIFDNATVGIYQSTPAGRFLSVNPAMARIYGYESPEEMLSRVVDIEEQDYVDAADRRKFQRVMEERGRITPLSA